MRIVIAVFAYLAVAVPLAIFLGKFMRHGMGGGDK